MLCADSGIPDQSAVGILTYGTIALWLLVKVAGQRCEEGSRVNRQTRESL